MNESPKGRRFWENVQKTNQPKIATFTFIVARVICSENTFHPKTVSSIIVARLHAKIIGFRLQTHFHLH